jgi:Cyclic nucleotide-binding domain
MGSHDDLDRYCIWGVDNIVYGPVDMATLVRWVQEERVTPNTWINLRERDTWEKAARITELKEIFQSRGPAVTLPAPEATSINLRAGALRRVKILAGLNDEQLERFIGFMELHPVLSRTEIVKQESPGDAMYVLLEGEVRVRVLIGGKERILVTLVPGEFFGEVSLFDHGPRSADVVANKESLLLRISAGAFQKLVQNAPDLAAPFLFGICRTLGARIRADNKRYRDSFTVGPAAK